MYKRVILLLIIFTSIACKNPIARKPISVKTGSYIDASVSRNKALYKKEKAQILKLLKSSKDSSNIKTSNNGFWFTYHLKIENDSLFTPKFGDLVNFNYSIKNLNGTVIYPLQQIKSYVMDQQELFSGLREGLKLLKAGESATFYFPSQKAYGYYGDENKIGANVPLICNVTINTITKK